VLVVDVLGNFLSLLQLFGLLFFYHLLLPFSAGVAAL
jgi:hypothetical protein